MSGTPAGAIADDFSSWRKWVDKRLRELFTTASQKAQLPPGTMVESAVWATNPPEGWLWAEGGTFLINDHPALYNAIGTLYGGNGTTTFGVPDMRGRVPVGMQTGDANFGTPNQKGGAKTHTLTVAEMPAHNHAKANGDGNYLGGGGGTGASIPGGGTSYVISGMANAGGGGAHNNLQPYIVLHWMIKT